MDKSKLREMTSADPEVRCYRCKAAPAVLVREMRTPNGSKYLRGWCMACVDGRPFRVLERMAGVSSDGEEGEADRSFKVGAEVSVRFEGRVLYYGVGAHTDVAFVRVGTRAYEVPASALCVRMDEEGE